jgi:hypothetical protein
MWLVVRQACMHLGRLELQCQTQSAPHPTAASSVASARSVSSAANEMAAESESEASFGAERRPSQQEDLDLHPVCYVATRRHLPANPVDQS